MMNNSCDAALKSSAKRYCDKIESAPFYETFSKNLQKVTILNEVDPFDFKNSLLSAIKKIGLENELRNDVFHWNRERDFFDQNVTCWVDKEPMDYLRKAQMQWEKRIYKSLNSMCTELGVSLSVFRLASDRDEIQEKWNLLSTHSIDLGQYRPVYAPKDFLDVLLNIQNPNHENSCGVSIYGTGWDFSLISLKVNSLAQLKINYEELINGEPLLATLSNSTTFYSKLEDERISFGQAVLNFNQAPVTQKFLKRLAPHCIREKLWSQVLGIEILPWHKEYFKTLKQFVIQYDMLVDKLIFKDIQLTVCNDDQYFVFEDLLYQVMLCFSRDNSVTNVFRCNSSNPIIGVLKGRSTVINNCVIYPPNGVIPFHGFSMYAAPLCYVFNDPVQLYFAFRSLYMRYWFRLHEVNSHQQGMLSLCILFQELLEFNEPKLCAHFMSIKVQPIKIVFKWLMRCFSGHLPPEQLLFLWDMILGYDSLEVIPLLAVAILSFRRDSLLEVDTLQNVEAVLADLSSIQVIPLLQFALISG